MIFVEYNPDLEQKLVFHTSPIALGYISSPKYSLDLDFPNTILAKKKL